LEYQELLDPCYHFGHTRGFAFITKHPAYNVVGHIEERRPEGVDRAQQEHMIPNNRVIGKKIVTRFDSDH
jgi:hypothetical protein